MWYHTVSPVPNFLVKGTCVVHCQSLTTKGKAGTTTLFDQMLQISFYIQICKTKEAFNTMTVLTSSAQVESSQVPRPFCESGNLAWSSHRNGGIRGNSKVHQDNFTQVPTICFGFNSADSGEALAVFEETFYYSSP